MLRTRVITAIILAGVLLAGLFLLSPPWAVLAFGAVFTVGAWEWAGFGALVATGPRVAYAAAIAVPLLLTWRWTEDRLHLLLLLGLACVWWLIALLWLSLV